MISFCKSVQANPPRGLMNTNTIKLYHPSQMTMWAVELPYGYPTKWDTNNKHSWVGINSELITKNHLPGLMYFIMFIFTLYRLMLQVMGANDYIVPKIPIVFSYILVCEPALFFGQFMTTIKSYTSYQSHVYNSHSYSWVRSWSVHKSTRAVHLTTDTHQQHQCLE